MFLKEIGAVFIDLHYVGKYFESFKRLMKLEEIYKKVIKKLQKQRDSENCKGIKSLILDTFEKNQIGVALDGRIWS